MNGQLATTGGDLKSLVNSEAVQKQLSRVLPAHLTADRFTRIAITAMTKTPKLLETTPASFIRCLLELSALGLEPDGRRACLIPYGRDCTLVIGYQGLIEIVTRSGNVQWIHADVVREGDTFEHDSGVVLRHTYKLGQDRGEIIGAYATASFASGVKQSAIMDVESINLIRDRSKSGKNGPWVTDWQEMAKKTTIRRLCKMLPMESEVSEAVARIDDNEHEFQNARPARARVEARNAPIDPASLPEAPEAPEDYTFSDEDIPWEGGAE